MNMKRGKKAKTDILVLFPWNFLWNINFNFKRKTHAQIYTQFNSFFLSSKRKTTQNNTHLSCDINLIEFEIACLCSFDCG